MLPRDPHCDNDDCDYDEEGRWVHVEGCDAEGFPAMTEEQARELVRNAPPDSFLTMYGKALGL